MLAAIQAPAEIQFWSFLFQLVILIAAALLMGLIFERLRQSAILGFLLAGTLLGPTVFGVVQSESGVAILAELGVSLLLFAIGLEFSAARLLRLGKIAVGGGSMQVVVTLAAAAAVALVCGLGGRVALAVGATVALSSTACVLRMLTDRAELDSVHGRSALGILLLQDVAVVPLVVLVTLLGGEGGLADLGIGFAKALGLIAAMVTGFYLFSNHVLPRLLGALNLSKNRELLILLAAVLAMGSAGVAHQLHISPALGAFIAGMMLAESPFATQIRSDVSALRVLFLTLFFVSVGMLGDPKWIIQHAGSVALCVAAVLFGKAAIITLIARLFGRPTRHAVACGVSLAQIGEFGIVIAGIGKASGLIGEDLFLLLVSTTIITLFLTPFLVSLALPLGRIVEQLDPGRKDPAAGASKDDERSRAGRSGHVIVAGFGPSGQQVGEALVQLGHPAIVLDLRPKNVDLAHSLGLDAAVGDATHLEVLLHHGLAQAKAIVISVPDHRASTQIVQAVRNIAPRISIIVRARYHPFVNELARAGATFVIDEEYHTGRRLAAAMHVALQSSD
jgi:CPA2 family monovalent cation:H+ antiporter-2